MTWEKDLEELRAREELARQMGGPEKVKRQHDHGKLTVRERIATLLDPDSFHEIGAIAGRASYDTGGELTHFTPANFVMGRGRIDARPVVVGGDDFTVRGGAADAAIWEKQIMAEQMAHEYGLPLVRLVDGTGGGGSVKSLEDMGFTYVPYNPGWDWVVANLSRVPVVSLTLGSVAGIGAARAVSAHYSVMVRGTSQMFTAGPPVVAALGQTLSKEDLGGSHIHSRNGAIDDAVESEAEAFARTRQFLSYLPGNVEDLPPRQHNGDNPARRDPTLVKVIPRDPRALYKIRPIINACVDADSFFEIGRDWGRAIVTGLARLNGWPVAIIASDPYAFGGAWSADAARKLERHCDLAQTFHLPVVHFVDVPGFAVGLDAEKAATIRHGARALSAIYGATVPWCSVILRKAYGVAGAAMSNHARVNFRYAWPSGDWGSLPLEGGIEAAYRAEIEAADDPVAKRAEIHERLDQVRSPFRTAEAFSVEEIIDPRDTRPLLCEFADLAAPLRKPGPAGRFRP